MCGIAGILTTRGDLDLGPILRAMRAAIDHRGPDDRGQEEVALDAGYRLGLAHTRLAIIDISSTGHQPMTDTASGSWITYNGEVYNHQAIRRELANQAFRGGSDTETILRAWDERGPAALDALRGMFAFGLYDGQRREFWLVRDRLGVKPLYVCRVDTSTWLFASELRALLASGLVERKLHSGAVDAYLAFGAVPAPWTLIEDVRSLLPGEVWHFDLSKPGGQLEPIRSRYWRPPFQADGRKRIGRDAALEQLRPVLAEAVPLRMVADVPVGVFLSGGIDSSAVVALLASSGFDLRTFSVVFGERAFDESEHSRAVARAFGTEHTELVLKPEEVRHQLDEALRAYDQPSIDGINSYFIAKATRAAGLKVAVSGLGGDELFGGYPYFRHLARFANPWQRALAGIAYQVLRRVAPGEMRTRKLGALLAGQGGRLENYAVCRQVMLPDQRRLLHGCSQAEGQLPLPAELIADLAGAAAGLDPINAHSLLELSQYMANMLLRDLDQMSMAHALEVREPLLDHRLVETVARLPGQLKLEPSRRSPIKALLVDALPVELPPQVAQRPKMGFVFPWEEWLRGALRERVTATLTDRAAIAAAGLDAAGIHVVWSGFLAHQPGLRYTDILCLLNLLEWVRHHGPGARVDHPVAARAG